MHARALTWDAGGRTILGPLDLAIRRGECLAVVGPNGAGKTTLLRLLAGVLAPATGTIAWRGDEYARLGRRELARRVAYVPQVRPARIPLTVGQLTLQGRFPHMPRTRLAPGRGDWAAVRAALERVDLTTLADRPLDELSGGERQAAFLAAALAQEAELLVLDEPTTHLDPRHQRQIAALVRSFARRGDRTVVTATHDLNFASLVAHRILALRDGRQLALAPPRDLVEPALLAELFEAPFEIVRSGDRPLTVLELED